MRISDWSSDVCSSDLSSMLEATERSGLADRAAEVDALVEDALTKLRLRLDLSDEAFSSGTAAIARDLGVPTDIASDLFGIDIAARVARDRELVDRSEEHTSELQALMRISYAVFCLQKKN